MLSTADVKRLRSLARLQLDFASSSKNEEILKKWNFQANKVKESPTVRLMFSNFTNEVITPRMLCSDPLARSIEYQLLSTMVGRELFDDDTPISPTFDVEWKTTVSPFGIDKKLSYTSQKNPKGFHIDPVIGELDEDIDKLRGGYFKVDRKATQKHIDFVQSVIGDILPVKMVMNSLCGAITNPLVHLMGMENYYFAMSDYPEKLHEVMDMATTFFENFYDFLEKENLLIATTGLSPVSQESFAFNNELPSVNVTKTQQCWGFLESQETTAVSPATFGEFVFPYQDRLAKRFGLLSYGCCERVDSIFEPYLSKWKNLRKLSVSPFNDEYKVGEYLKNSGTVYYSKPRAEYVTNPGALDEEALMKYFKMVCQASSGCLLEISQREVGTIFGDFNRGKRYVEIAKEAVNRYWKP